MRKKLQRKVTEEKPSYSREEIQVSMVGFTLLRMERIS